MKLRMSCISEKVLNILIFCALLGGLLRLADFVYYIKEVVMWRFFY